MALSTRLGRLTVVDPPTLVAGWPAGSGYLARQSAEVGLSVRSVWRTQPSVRKVTSFIAETVAALPWRVYVAGDGGRVRAWDSPAETVLRAPGRWQSGQDLIEALCLDHLLWGTALAVLVDGEVVRVPPPLVTVVMDSWGRVADIVVGVAGDGVSVSALPTALLRGWSPDGDAWVSPVRTLRGLLSEVGEAEEWRHRQWTDQPRISAQIVRPLEAPRWSDAARERLQHAMREYRSVEAGGIPVMEDGMRLEDAPGGASVPDMAVASNVRTLTDIEVAAYFRVPPELIGAREANYGGYAALRRDLYTRVLGPLIGRIESALMAEIVPALDSRPGVYGVLDRSEAQDGTLLERVQALQAATGAPVMTRAEARERLDLPYLPGTEEMVVPLNVLSGGQASPSDSGSQNLDGGSDSAIEDHRAGKGAAKAAEVLELAARLGGVRVMVGDTDEVLGERIARVLGDDVAATLLEAANREILRSGTGTATLQAADMAHYSEAVVSGQSVGVARRVLSVRESMDDPLALRSVLAVLGRAGTETVATGVVRSAEASGAYHGAEVSGAVEKEWVHTAGAKAPRSAHQALAGERAPMDGVFSNGMRFPRDWSNGDVSECAYCGCRVEYVW